MSEMGKVEFNRIMRDATYRMWVKELNAVFPGTTKPDWKMRRLAAEQICEAAGIKDIIRAFAADVSQAVPHWPEVSCVPLGGGDGLITCEVRTTKDGARHSVKIALARPPGKRKFDSAQIAEAIERGKFELVKKFESVS